MAQAIEEKAAEIAAMPSLSESVMAAHRRSRPVLIPMDKREVVQGTTTQGVRYSYKWGVPITSQTLLTFVDTMVEEGVAYLMVNATIDGEPDVEILLVPEKRRAGVHWVISPDWGWVDAETVRDAIEAYSTDAEMFGQDKGI